MVLTYNNEIQIRVQSEAKESEPKSDPFMTKCTRSSLGQQRTCFNDATPRSYGQPRADERDISQIEDLGAVWEGKGP